MAQFLQLNTPISQHDWQMVLSDITDHDEKICTEQKSKNTKKIDLVPSGIDVTTLSFIITAESKYITYSISTFYSCEMWVNGRGRSCCSMATVLCN